MKTKKIFVYALLTSLGIYLSSCSATHHSMREPNSRVNFVSQDFTFSPQVTGEAKEIKVFGIDWGRLFNKPTGSVETDRTANAGISLASIPVIGSFISPKDRASEYALFNLMLNTPGYDVVFYPQFERIEKRPIGIPIIRITTVKVKARLAKLKSN